MTPSGPRAERTAQGEDAASRRPEPPGDGDAAQGTEQQLVPARGFLRHLMKTEKASPKPPEETSGFPEPSINAQSGGSHGGGSERSTVSSFSEPRRWRDLNTGNRVQIQTGTTVHTSLKELVALPPTWVAPEALKPQTEKEQGSQREPLETILPF